MPLFFDERTKKRDTSVGLIQYPVIFIKFTHGMYHIVIIYWYRELLNIFAQKLLDK
jgi:hypothetical protein